MQKIYGELAKRNGGKDSGLPKIAKDLNIPRQNLTGYLPDGRRADYYGHAGTINVGPGDYKAQMDALFNEVTGGRNYARDTRVSGEYNKFAYAYKALKDDDGIISKGDVSALEPVLRELARVLGKEKALDERTNHNITVYVTE
jgi:hypothetical protein